MIAGDIYHYVITGPLLYLVLRRALRGPDLDRFVTGALVVAAIHALVALQIVALSGADGYLVWLVGQPLDEGGVRLEFDFGFPMAPLLLATDRVARRPSLLHAVIAAVLMAVLVLTYKRTLWLATLAGVAVVLGLRLPRVRSVRRRAVVLGTLVLIVPAGVGLASLAGLNADSARTRGRELAAPTAVGTFKSREEEWREVLPQLARAPLGHGLGGSVPVEIAGRARRIHHVHGMYLQWALVGGWLLPVAGLLAALAAAGRAARRRAHPAGPGVAGGLVAFLVAGLAVVSFNAPYAAILLALGATSTTGDPDDAPPAPVSG